MVCSGLLYSRRLAVILKLRGRLEHTILFRPETEWKLLEPGACPTRANNVLLQAGQPSYDGDIITYCWKALFRAYLRMRCAGKVRTSCSLKSTKCNATNVNHRIRGY